MLDKTTIILSVAAYGLAIGGILMAHTGLVVSSAGAVVFAVGALFGLAAVGCSIAVIFTTQHFAAALIGVAGALPFLVLVTGAVDAMRYPRINDITTDRMNPPAFVTAPTLPENAGRDFAFPEENAPLIEAAYPDCNTLRLDLTPGTAYARARAAADRMPRWEITRESEEEGVFEAVASTRVFRWHDDLVVRVLPDGDGGSLVDMRSKSREGKSDLGANARRIRHYFYVLTR